MESLAYESLSLQASGRPRTTELPQQGDVRERRHDLELTPISVSAPGSPLLRAALTS